MPFRPIFLAWLLLLGATLAIGGVAWWLLGREASRVESLTAGTLANRAATIAENIDLLMEEIKTGVDDALLTVRGTSDPIVSLASLDLTNPYVRAGFLFNDLDEGIVWSAMRGNSPDSAVLEGLTKSWGSNYPWTPSSTRQLPDQKRINEALGKIRLEEAIVAAGGLKLLQQESIAPSDYYAEPDVETEPQIASDQGQNDAQYEDSISSNQALKQQRAAVRNVNAYNVLSLKKEQEVAAKSKREGLPEVTDYDMAGLYPRDKDPAAPDAPLSGLLDEVRRDQQIRNLPPRQGWTTEKLVDGIEWIAWTDLPERRGVVGVWLDRKVVLAELAKTISLSQRDGIRVMLVDSEDRVVVGQSGPGKSYGETPPEPQLSLAVGTALPGWRIEVFRPNGSNPFGPSFRLLGGVVVAGLCLAIMVGGSLLVWQARRDAHEAQRKTTFVANVSHELKTPLTSIRLFAEMLQDGRVKDPNKRAQYLETMVTETQRLTRLVNNVLDFSRLDRGHRDFQQESQDLVVVVSDIVKPQIARLASEGLQVEMLLPNEPLQRLIDRDALEQVLLNLLDNAAKYAASGGRAEVRLEALGSGWSLSVCDWGPGIPARERARVFDAFYRLDDRLTTERAGCGLGLSIAARLVKGLGGEVELLPNQPQGCCFRLTFKGKTIS